MKKLYMLFFSLLIGGLFSTTSQAQTSIDITWSGDSLGFYCLPNARVWEGVGINTTGYVAGDSIDVTIYWGDGTNTTERVPIWFSSGGTQGANAGVFHTYTAPGSYTLMVVATAVADGMSDTVMQTPAVNISTCGNLEGTAYIDNNNDCTYNAGDTPIPNAMISVTDASTSSTYYASTDASGEYDVLVPVSGSYDVALASPFLSVSCPSGGHTGVTAPSAGIDFGIQCGSGFDLFGSIYGFGFRPARATGFYAFPFNASCNAQGGTMTIVMSDPRITFNAASTTNPPVVNGDSITWTFSPIDYTSISASWVNWHEYWFSVLTDTNAVLGDSICMEVIVTPASGDNDPANNVLTFCFPISNSFDPNEKNAQPMGVGQNNIIAPGTSLDYTVHFQNTGNDVAYDIFIIDELDANLDQGSLVINASSHAMTYEIFEGNKLRFDFKNINLPDSNSNEPMSHGFVSYTVNQKPGIALGTVIQNTAAIYFDYNDPIITNTTFHTVDIIDGIAVNKLAEDLVSIYPNPAKGNITVNMLKNERGMLTIKSLMGQSVNTFPLNAGTNVLDLSGLTPGIYLMEVNVANQLQVKRVIVQ